MARPNHFSGDDIWEENTRAGLDEDFEWTPADSVADPAAVPAPSTDPAYEDVLAYLLREPERSRWAEYARHYRDNQPRNLELARAACATLAERLVWIEERLALARDRAGYLRDFLAASERVEVADRRVAKLEAALRYYAERRNYVPAAPPAVQPPDHLMQTDAWDGEGPGARARAALAGDGGGA